LIPVPSYMLANCKTPILQLAKSAGPKERDCYNYRMGKDDLTFDKGLDNLESIVQKLEGGALGLEDALKLYEEGVRLSTLLQKQLADAQRKVEVLRQGLGGEFRAEPLEGEG